VYYSTYYTTHYSSTVVWFVFLTFLIINVLPAGVADFIGGGYSMQNVDVERQNPLFSLSLSLSLSLNLRVCVLMHCIVLSLMSAFLCF